MLNGDLARIINSDEVQSVVRPIKKAPMKKNPLRNLNTMLRLNPYAKTARRASLLAEAHRVQAKKEKRKPISKEEAQAIRAAGKSWYQTMIPDSDYTEFDVFSKWLAVSQWFVFISISSFFFLCRVAVFKFCLTGGKRI